MNACRAPNGAAYIIQPTTGDRVFMERRSGPVQVTYAEERKFPLWLIGVGCLAFCAAFYFPIYRFIVWLF